MSTYRNKRLTSLAHDMPCLVEFEHECNAHLGLSETEIPKGPRGDEAVRCWLYKLREEEKGEVIELTVEEYERVRLGYGDYRVRPIDEATVTKVPQEQGLEAV